MPNRRNFLRSLPGVPLLGGVSVRRAAAARAAQRDFLRELGVRPFINAAGT